MEREGRGKERECCLFRELHFLNEEREELEPRYKERAH